MKKILFLDIDGVLNNRWTSVRLPWKGRFATGVDPKLVEVLNSVLDRTGAQVVISSDWRHHLTLDQIRDHLVQQGFTGEIVGATEPGTIRWGGTLTTRWATRGLEVRAWLDDNCAGEPVVHAIVDDRSDFAPDQPLVKTHPSWGIQQPHADRLVEILGPIDTGPDLSTIASP